MATRTDQLDRGQADAEQADAQGHDGGGSDGGRLDAAAVALLVSGMACFGSATPVSRVVGRSFPVWLGSGARMVVAILVLVPALLLWKGRHGGLVSDLRSTSGGDRLLLLGMGAIGTFAFSVLMLLGMREAPGSVGAVVMAMTPAVTAVGAAVFLRDRLGWVRIVAIVLAVAGVVVVNVGLDPAQGSGDRPALGSLLVFGAVCCEATYSLMGKRLTSDLDPLTITLAAAAVAFVLLLPLAAWDATTFRPSTPDVGEWIALVWWGAGTMALGSVLWFFGMRRVSGATAAPFMAVMPLSALLLSYLVLGEPFHPVHLAGIGLVLVGLLLVVTHDDD
ncbi:hypothetical protein B7486_58215 [cyanobacterium TDX16]|nr:hypothetical protein B7486_58215 [cyanobacterium TDX16]